MTRFRYFKFSYFKAAIGRHNHYRARALWASFNRFESGVDNATDHFEIWKKEKGLSF